MGKWIKENLVLVSGILLPMLLVGGFFLLNSMPRMLADPPAHDFLVVAYQYDYQSPANHYLSFEVRDGKLNGLALPIDEDHRYISRQNARLFLYRSKKNAFEEFVFELPDNLQSLEEPVALNLGEASELKLDKRMQAPDGYQFEFLGYGGRGGMLGEIFGMGRSYESSYVLKKGSHYVDLPEPSINPNQYQNDLQFLGWVVEEGSTP